jgi:hypothetical protein
MKIFFFCFFLLFISLFSASAVAFPATGLDCGDSGGWIPNNRYLTPDSACYRQGVAVGYTGGFYCSRNPGPGVVGFQGLSVCNGAAVCPAGSVLGGGFGSPFCVCSTGYAQMTSSDPFTGAMVYACEKVICPPTQYVDASNNCSNIPDCNTDLSSCASQYFDLTTASCLPSPHLGAPDELPTCCTAGQFYCAPTSSCQSGGSSCSSVTNDDGSLGDGTGTGGDGTGTGGDGTGTGGDGTGTGGDGTGTGGDGTGTGGDGTGTGGDGTGTGGDGTGTGGDGTGTGGDGTGTGGDGTDTGGTCLDCAKEVTLKDVAGSLTGIKEGVDAIGKSLKSDKGVGDYYVFSLDDNAKGFSSSIDEANAELDIQKNQFSEKMDSIKFDIETLFSNSFSGGAASLPSFTLGTFKGVELVYDLNRWSSQLSAVASVILLLAYLVSFSIILGS